MDRRKPFRRVGKTKPVRDKRQHVHLLVSIKRITSRNVPVNPARLAISVSSRR